MLQTEKTVGLRFRSLTFKNGSLFFSILVEITVDHRNIQSHTMKDRKIALPQHKSGFDGSLLRLKQVC
jgi:hypothetical protein